MEKSNEIQQPSFIFLLLPTLAKTTGVRIDLQMSTDFQQSYKYLISLNYFI